MANLDSINYAKINSSPAEKINPGEFNGRVKCIHDSYELDGSNVLALNDIIKSVKIPEGALILEAFLYVHQTLGATGIVQLGHDAGEDIDGNALVADPDALVAQADAGGQAVFQKSANEALIGKKIGKGGLELQVKCTEVSVVTSGKISWGVYYSID